MKPPILPPTKRPGYPLGMLFVLIALVAVLLAMDAAVMKDRFFEQTSIVVITLLFPATGLVGGLLGGFIGLFHYRRILGSLWGVLTGMTLGPLLMPLLVAEETHIGPLMVVTLFGCALIMAMAVGIRLGVGRRRMSTRAWHEDEPTSAE